MHNYGDGGFIKVALDDLKRRHWIDVYKRQDERERNGRYFTDMTEDKMKGLLDTVDVFSVEDMWVTSDVRPGRDEEKWLNMILRKK